MQYTNVKNLSSILNKLVLNIAGYNHRHFIIKVTKNIVPP